MSVAPEGGRNRIMIYWPKDDGTYLVEFRTAAGEALAISIPRAECAVIRHFQERSLCWTFREEHPPRWGVLADGVLPVPLVRVPETPPDLPLQMP